MTDAELDALIAELREPYNEPGGLVGPAPIIEIRAADAIAALRAERDAAFAAGMRRAAEVCNNAGADWAYDLIITDLERLEE